MPQLKLPMALTGRWFPRTLNPRIADLLEPAAPPPEPLLRQLDELLQPAPREFPTEPLPLWETPPPREMPRAMAPIESPPAAQPLLPIDFPSLKLDPVGPPPIPAVTQRRVRVGEEPIAPPRILQRHHYGAVGEPPVIEPLPTEPFEGGTRPIFETIEESAAPAVRDLQLDPVSYEPIPMRPRSPREELVRDNVYLPPIDEDLVRRIDPATDEDWFDATRRAQMEVPLGGPEEALLNLFDDPALKGRAESAMKAIRARTSPEMFQDDVLTPGLNAAARPLDDLDPAVAADYQRRLPQTILEDLEGQATTARNVAPIDPGQFGLPDEGPTWGQTQRLLDAQARINAEPFYTLKKGEVAIPTPARKSLLEDADEGGVPTGGKTLRPHTRKESREREDEVVRRDVESRTTPVRMPTAAELELPWETRRGGTADTMTYGDTGITKGPWTAPEGPTFGMGERVRLPDGREGRVRQMLRSSDQVEAMVDSLGSFGSGAKDFTRHEMMAKKGTRPTKVIGPDGKTLTIDAKGLKTLNLPDVRGRDLAGKTEADFADLPGPRKRMTVVESADGRLYAAAEGGLNKEGVWPGWQPAIKPVIVDVDDGTVWRGGADKVTATGEYEYEKGKRLRAAAAPQAPAAKSAEAPTVNLKGGRAFEWRSSRLTPIKVGRTKEGVDKIRVQTPGGQEFWLEVPPGAKELKGRDGKILAILKDPAALGGALLAGGAVAGLAEGESPQDPQASPTLAAGVTLGPVLQSLIKSAEAARSAGTTTDLVGKANRAVTSLYDSGTVGKQAAKGIKSASGATAESLVQGAGGALGEALNTLHPLQETWKALDQEGLGPLYNLYMDLGRAKRAFGTLEEKTGSLSQRAKALANSGREAEAQRLFAEADLYQKNLDTGHVAPISREQMAAAEQEFAALPPEVQARVKEAAELTWAQNDLVLQMLADEGIPSPMTVSSARERNKRLGVGYVPGTHVMEQLDPLTGAPMFEEGLTQQGKRKGVSLSLKESEIVKKLTGSDRAYTDPREATAAFHRRAAQEIYRSKVARTLATEIFPQDPELSQVMRLSSTPPKGGPDTGSIAFYQNGKPVYVELPKVLADVYNFAHVFDVQSGFRAWHRTKKIWQELITTGSLPFVAAQAAMDPVAAMTLTPWEGEGFVKGGARFLKNVPKAAKAAFGDAWSGGLSPERAEWRRNYGSMSGLSGLGMSDETLAYGPNAGKPLWAPSRAIELIKESVTTPLEETWKMAGYYTLLEQGASPWEAMLRSRKFTGSPDYAQKGALTPQLEPFFVFLNPAIQGIGRTFEAIAQRPQQVGAAALAATTSLAFLDRYNRDFINPETGESFWNDVPLDQKRRNWILFIGEPARAADGRLYQPSIRIPMDHSLRLLTGPIMDALDQDQVSSSQAAFNAVGNLLPFSQVQIDEQAPVKSAGRQLVSSLHPAAKTIIEMLSNTQAFSGAPIVGRRTEGLRPELQQTANTSQIARTVAGAAGMVPGAETLGLTSPDRVDHAISSLLPGLGEMATGAVEMALPSDRPDPGYSGWEALSRNKVAGPLFRRFVGPMPSATRKDLGQQAADLSRETSQATQSLNYLEKLGDPGRVEDFLTRRPNDLALRQANSEVTRVQQALGELGFQREQAQSGAMGLEGEALVAFLASLNAQEQALRQQMDVLAEILGQ